VFAVFLSDFASVYQTSSKMGLVPPQWSYDVIHFDVFKVAARVTNLAYFRFQVY